MNERKILFFIFFAIVYCFYNVQLWFFGTDAVNKTEVNDKKDVIQQAVKESVRPRNMVKSTLRRLAKDSCNVVEIFTNNPFTCELPEKPVKQVERMTADNNTIAVLGITVFLIALTLNAILDVIKVKEEERARLKLNPGGERRQSLAEFANKKYLRRESSRFSLNLFQIAESFVSSGDSKKTVMTPTTKQARPYTRGDSINSYLSEKKKKSEGSAPASIGETAEPKLVKRQSVAKLFGGRPVPMVRRSSFPALPLNPEVQALMLGHKQASFDSDDEDGKGRRVRIIRRY